MIREHSAGSYQMSAYFVARTIADLSVQLISPVVFSIVIYPLVGYQAEASNFFLYMLLNQRLVRFNLVIDFVSYLLLQFVLCFGEVQVIVGDYLGSSLDFHYRFISLDIKME